MRSPGDVVAFAARSALACSALCLAAALPEAQALTFTVDNTGDAGASGLPSNGVCDSQPGPGVACTLRAAIQEANNTAGGPHTIGFNIGPATITLGSPLPQITTAMIIDGTLDPAFGGAPL